MASNTFSDWTKIFGDFKNPAVDVNQIISVYRRNAETGSAVIQLLTESTQAIARRSAEIGRANAEQLINASKALMNKSTPESAASKHADYAKNCLKFNVDSARELAEMCTKSTQEALDLINKRVAEGVKEFSDAASNAAPSAKKKAA